LSLLSYDAIYFSDSYSVSFTSTSSSSESENNGLFF